MLNLEEIKKRYRYSDGNLVSKIRSGSKNPGDIIGSLKKNGYLATTMNGKHYLVHRIIFLLEHGYLPKNVDHIDGNRSNNHIDNLRDCDPSGNNKNAKISSRNKTGVKGTYFNKKLGKYHAYIQSDKKRFHLGFFLSLDDAKEAVSKARKELHGKFAKEG